MRAIRFLAVVVFLVVAVAALAPRIAFAYPDDSTAPEGVERTECIHCHGWSEGEVLVPSDDTPVRKGPHGGYSVTTSRCQTCHTLHVAPVADGLALLPGKTIQDVCQSCHDGTGGAAVYGVIKARTGLDVSIPGVGSSHRIETEGNNVVPGGAVDLGDHAVEFSGPGGQLTCSDCHSPHGSDTVEPFLGDRLRADVASDTAAAAETDRLLRRVPTGSEVPVDVYGAGWCAGCHKERAVRHAEGSGAVQDHPVAQDDTYHYGSLPVVSATGSIETTLGGLGRSNRGYVMPGPVLAEPTLKTPLQEAGTGPICQQCHEDARAVAPSERWTNPVLGADQEFRVTAYGGDAEPYDNPRFQLFPHESATPNFLVRAPEPEEPASLCLNCHSLLHEADPGSDLVAIFAPRQHDLPGDYADRPYSVLAECGMCHTTDLLAAHGDRCETCHSAPYDTLATWDGGCAQGGCHVEFHSDYAQAHEPWADPFDSANDCDLCHGPAWWPDDSSCQNCHALYIPGGTTAPLTTSDVRASYTGPALIRFSATTAGKVAVATTFHRLDGGEVRAGSRLSVEAPGSHTVEFWSEDQNGNVETPAKSVTFMVLEDTTPPVTTASIANGQVFYRNASIRLDAVDDSTAGVKATYYTLDGGPVQMIAPGGSLTVTAVEGVTDHTLNYWSEDWSGNIEEPRTIGFQIRYGTATLRIIWGGTPPPDAWAEWWVYGNNTYPRTIVASGANGGVGWSGIEEVALPVRAAPYYVRVYEYIGSTWEDDRYFDPLYIHTPGAVYDIVY